MRNKRQQQKIERERETRRSCARNILMNWRRWNKDRLYFRHFPFLFCRGEILLFAETLFFSLSSSFIVSIEKYYDFQNGAPLFAIAGNVNDFNENFKMQINHWKSEGRKKLWIITCVPQSIDFRRSQEFAKRNSDGSDHFILQSSIRRNKQKFIYNLVLLKKTKETDESNVAIIILKCSFDPESPTCRKKTENTFWIKAIFFAWFFTIISRWWLPFGGLTLNPKCKWRLSQMSTHTKDSQAKQRVEMQLAFSSSLRCMQFSLAGVFFASSFFFFKYTSFSYLLYDNDHWTTT